jgi:hypothetical protein
MIATSCRETPLLTSRSYGVVVVPSSTYPRTWKRSGAGPAVEQLVHDRGVAVEVEDDGCVRAEQRAELGLCHALGMPVRWSERMQIHDVHYTNARVGHVAPQQLGRSERLDRLDSSSMFFAVLQEGRWPPGPAWLSPLSR